ncbi:ABC transporter substrate-binding protein [Photobacterium sp. GB-27]|uniref:HD domain-containing phosphohydrolase n=1 Tax=unclassified Photobacterium TaxID=2628852 RepID=UPI000D40B30F|nr:MULTISPECIES: HD domain-containing phosphohydrolase [unclassified Photobacterium]PSV37784.1 ABC transporter substrate-binding protein [Photobacterium sp. GB-210]PSV38452.1 ABC transporter substrate-binding protein [Photobacterium sp. GB-27]PSV45094.1 ABC transporter substrate-binding protein [Photobacterium sp. GB-36]PSW74232.1 ABC transporter substrate-binding protein [Photobacterium sp. GB-50]
MLAESVSDAVTDVSDDAIATVKYLSHLGTILDSPSKDVIRRIFTNVLKDNPSFYSAFIGTDKNYAYIIINLDSMSEVRRKNNALKQDRWLIIERSADSNGMTQYDSFYDANFNLRKKIKRKNVFSPTLRSWYINATRGSVFRTEPYLFLPEEVTGITYSTEVPTDKGKVVVGIDFTLSHFNKLLQENSVSDVSHNFLYLPSGELVASSEPSFRQQPLPKSKPLVLTPEEQKLIKNTPILRVSNKENWAPIDFTISGRPAGLIPDLLYMVGQSTGLEFDFFNGAGSLGLQQAYSSGGLDILTSVPDIPSNQGLGIFSKPLFKSPFAIAVSDSKHYEKLQDLNGKRLALLSNWPIISVIKEKYPLIDIVTYSHVDQALRAVKKGEVDAFIDLEAVLSYVSEQFMINDLTYHTLNIENSFPLSLVLAPEKKPLLDIINRAIESLTPQQQHYLQQRWLNSDVEVNRTGVVPYVELIDFAADESYQNQLIEKNSNDDDYFYYVRDVRRGGHDQIFFASMVPKASVYAASEERIRTSIYTSALLLLVLLPLAGFCAKPIVKPILLLRKENKKVKLRHYSDVAVIPTRIKEFHDLSMSIYTTAESLQEHEKRQDEFVESFIQLIAQAIDDKSPYTAGHCNRVPEIALMFAREVEKSNQGQFADFRFKNAAERREFKIAAWLHDCGKITTPEHIVDKGTKLEANYNRIHEIRMRFEVLWRDAELKYLQHIIDNPHEQEIALATLKQTQTQLQDDYKFVANANVGGEFMSDEHIARIHEIANKTWLRHFDDHLGLSPLEELSVSAKSETLPVEEHLLVDKREHCIKRINELNFDPAFGIKMQVPELQYNLGEIYNLTIKRGTLTAEDRFKINEHMISTIKMLESLPFPDDLARVPRYASTHHETMKGTGYPRKLSAKDLSTPERILVISDIFEALTAADRPYKKAKPLSVAIDILHKMALDEHIDMDLFKLFLSSGVYMQYAEKFLPSKQIDEVDIDKYLSS